MVRIGEEEREHIRNTLGQYTFYRESDFPGLEFISKKYAPQKIYYPGSFIDLAPVLKLDSGREYYYQEQFPVIADPIYLMLEFLQEKGIVNGLKETNHTRDGYTYPEFSFSVGNRPKILSIFEGSDVTTELISEVGEADLIYGYLSLITDEMLQKVKRGALILDHPGGFERYYRISREQAKKHHLVRPRISYNQSTFEGSSFYRKKQEKIIAQDRIPKSA